MTEMRDNFYKLILATMQKNIFDNKHDTVKTFQVITKDYFFLKNAECI